MTVTFDDGDTIRARYVVGADGIHSTVRTRAGIGFSGSEYPESFVLADVHLIGDVPEDEVMLFWATAGLTVVAPLPGGIYRIVAPVADAPDEPSVQFVQRVLDERGPGEGRMTVTSGIGERYRLVEVGKTKVAPVGATKAAAHAALPQVGHCDPASLVSKDPVGRSPRGET